MHVVHFLNEHFFLDCSGLFWWKQIFKILFLLVVLLEKCKIVPHAISFCSVGRIWELRIFQDSIEDLPEPLRIFFSRVMADSYLCTYSILQICILSSFSPDEYQIRWKRASHKNSESSSAVGLCFKSPRNRLFQWKLCRANDWGTVSPFWGVNSLYLAKKLH